MAGWVLLPLRLFLGFTFCFAGLQKLANPNFFDANSPSSIQAQMIAAERFSPLHSLIGHLLQFATPIGVLIALGELAVGLGALLGLWTRVAALGGMVLSLTLLLTVSWHASPYYTGADIVFLFAWTPLLLAGAGGVLSLDALIAARTRREAGMGPPNLVPIRFELVQRICGQYVDDRCRARHNQPCNVTGCPFLGDERASAVERRGLDDLDRRTVVLGGTAAAVVGVVALLGAGVVAAVGRAVGGAKSAGSGTTSLSTGSAGSSSGGSGGATTTTGPSGSPTTTAPTGGSGTPPGVRIGPAKDVPVGGAASFTDPKTGDPSLVLQLQKGQFLAYDAVCPHAGCTVGYSPAAQELVCPCHGSQFSPETGAVQVGPAATGLRKIPIAEGSNGDLYVQA
jgi:thiosulfate dehydrogenase [quinone] large subunit